MKDTGEDNTIWGEKKGKIELLFLRNIIKSRGLYVLFVFAMSQTGCNLGFDKIYRAGNLNIIAEPVETDLKLAVVRRYSDSLIRQKYAVPDKWLTFSELMNYDDSEFQKQFYFKDGPEELYSFSYSGILMFNGVYNPIISKEGWIVDSLKLSHREHERIKLRIQGLLSEIEDLSRKDGMAEVKLQNSSEKN